MTDIVVCNPGSVPEMSRMAGALARAGLLREFITPVAVHNTDARRVWTLPLVDKVYAEFRRRELPDGIPPEAVRNEATVLEIMSVIAARAGRRSASRWLVRRRNHLFDHRASRRVLPTDHAVVGSYTSARTVLRECRRSGIQGVLNYSIAHHRYSRRLLGEEARLQPRFAPTLQFHTFPPAQERQMDDEIALADTVLTLSSFQRSTFEAEGVSSTKLVVTPLGVDLDLFRPVPRVPDGVFRVIFVGQIGQRKGLSYLLEACRLAAIPQLELLFVGRPVGPTHTWDKLSFVRHMNHVPRWELPTAYAQADVYVLPSLIEGFGLTALEAMASGLPVVLSTNTFASDIITDGDNGFVIPIRDAQALADSLRHVYERPELRQSMGALARRRAEAFSWDSYGERIVEVLGP